jgi:hypothetical protein
MAPILIANVLTVTFVYCFTKIHQKELAGDAKTSAMPPANEAQSTAKRRSVLFGPEGAIGTLGGSTTRNRMAAVSVLTSPEIRADSALIRSSV